MKNPYPLIKYTITYDYESKNFSLKDEHGVLLREGLHGRELGREAWDSGAEEVVYNYNLAIDENIPLRLRHEYLKDKTRS